MPIVDAHAHIYPSKIAAKAAQSVADFYTLPVFGEGSGQHLIDACAASPITHFLVHSVAVKPSTVESINTFIADQCALHPEFIGFAAMHQDYENMEAEVERAVKLGLRGFKIHPDTQACNIDDPRLMRLYEIIEGRLPIVIHTGDYRYDYSHPRRLAKVLKAFPNLVVDATHMGGWSIFDIGYDWLKSENCFVDTSSCLHWMGARRLREFIDLYGADRVMFGSDYPLFNPVEELAPLQSGISSEDFEKITWRNVERFCGVRLADEASPTATPGAEPASDPASADASPSYLITGACIGCGNCAFSCPAGAIVPDMPYFIDQTMCMRCGACADVCPMQAIFAIEG